jgi:serine/threonine-protein kinase HipA
MNRCPITYLDIPSGDRYSPEGLKLLSRRLNYLNDLPYSSEEQIQEAIARATKMSIQGVQPKLSARLNVTAGIFEIVDTGGEYILKPQIHYPEVPQNEDLTMKLAESAGIEVPIHGLVYSKDRTLTYFIRRFDRAGRKEKVPVEDFAQLLGMTRDDKYKSSMEQVVSVIDEYCTFPGYRKGETVSPYLFNFLTGNEDMHLKNFSLIRRNGKVELSPAYDLSEYNSIALPNVTEEIALPVGGKKRNLTRKILIDYFGKERLKLTEPAMTDVLSDFADSITNWKETIQRSYLSEKMKEKYSDVLSTRRKVLDLQ